MKKLSIIFLIILAFAFAPSAWAASDPSYQAKVHGAGPDEQVIESGGKISVLSGGEIEVASGGLITGLALKIATIAMTAVDYTLSAAEALCNILIVTGSPSGNAIIAPTVSTSGVSVLYTVRNAGADSASVVIKKSAGTGVTVATGKTAEVFWSGSDYVRKTPDATN